MSNNIQETGAAPIKKKKMKKTVQFDAYSLQYAHLHINDYTPEEVSSTWYESLDFDHFRVELVRSYVLLEQVVQVGRRRLVQRVEKKKRQRRVQRQQRQQYQLRNSPSCELSPLTESPRKENTAYTSRTSFEQQGGCWSIQIPYWLRSIIHKEGLEWLANE